MADEEDSFIREVNEELRRENARALWGRYGPILIGAAIALVFATAAWQGYTYWIEQKASRIGGQLVKALELSKEAYDKGLTDPALSDALHAQALAELEKVKESDFGAYPTLAAFRQAALFSRKGDGQAAVQAFDAIANDSKALEILRNMAALRAAYLLVDIGTLQDVEARVKMLASDNNTPLKLAAREALGLAAWKAQDLHQARDYFERIVADETVLNTDFQARATQMLTLITDRLPPEETPTE